ncbi:MAG: PIN domain-containing protein [Candidatus Rokubacteria bacterium]|nr:PIN domain-containing protein [Candidatus Rokubacteria bacterium]
MPSRKPPTERGDAAAGRLFVDSGAWIALRNRRDQYHVLADRLFRTAVRDRRPLFTTNLVIAESHRLTLFRVGVLAALRALDRIDASERVTVHFATEADHVAARRWIERLAPRPVTYTDAISFAVMETLGCRDVLGFDRDFEVAGFTLWRD